MHTIGNQRGVALLIVLLVLVLGMTALLGGVRGTAWWKIRHDRKAAAALAQAREALIGDAALQTPVSAAGYLRLPDLGFGVGNAPSEGSSAPNFSGNGKDYSVAGKLPWRTLGLEPQRDGQEQCLWYVVSGRFKNTPATDALNWDTRGQLTLVDANGNTIASGVAALLVAPGPPLDGQQRAQSDAAYAQCGGNYDVRNYLDSYDAADGIAGAVNYFGGGINSRVATDAGDKVFVAADSRHYNDIFLAVAADDIFRVLTRRADFAAQVSALLDDSYFRDVVIAGSKGTDNVNCGLLAGAANRAFCRNWKEMLLLTQLAVPAPVMLDGAPTATCSRVLLFGGRRTAAQGRLSAADKSMPANYLEGANLASYAAPVAASGKFSASSTFRADLPEADLLRCLP